ncbi:MAG TPA: hypothetical protein VN213_08405 [Solirubrobacteraceae bacterium]|nr:hypothetical protein [Solirubrobacteraceae bacterium]
MLMLLDGDPAFHIDAGATRILCAHDPDDVTDVRVLLDSVLFTTALLRGLDVLHCGAVATDAGAVAIAAASGGGKSTLTARLVADGRPLVTADILALARRPGAAPLAHPGPPVLTRPAGAPEVGRPIATLDGETWCALETVDRPLPLAGVVLLDRRPGADLRLTRARSPLIELMPHLLGFPDRPERARSRFELAADIAASTPVWRLVADTAVPPETLAQHIRPALTDSAQLRA